MKAPTSALKPKNLLGCYSKGSLIIKLPVCVLFRQAFTKELPMFKYPFSIHNDHRAGAGVDIVREYEVRLGSLQIQMKFYLEKMKLR